MIMSNAIIDIHIHVLEGTGLGAGLGDGLGLGLGEGLGLGLGEGLGLGLGLGGTHDLQ